jgi:hypothetical protein
VYLEARGEKGADAKAPSEWPSQTIEDKKCQLRQALELACVVAKKRKSEAEDLKRKAATQTQPPPKKRKG